MKYELTDETKRIEDHILHRVRYLIDIPRFDIRAGELGGWIESEHNLSQDGDCAVCNEAEVYGRAEVRDDAKVYGRARVYADARVCDQALVCDDALVCDQALVGDNAEIDGDAQVCGQTWVLGLAQISRRARLECKRDYLVVGPIGSRDDFTTAYRTVDGVSVSCGCFNGTLDEFAKRVQERHGDNHHGRNYRAMIDLINQFFGVKNHE